MPPLTSERKDPAAPPVVPVRICSQQPERGRKTRVGGLREDAGRLAATIRRRRRAESPKFGNTVDKKVGLRPKARHVGDQPERSGGGIALEQVRIQLILVLGAVGFEARLRRDQRHVAAYARVGTR